MFQFRRFPTHAYLIQRVLTGSSPAGFPHSEIHGSKPICGSPWLIAACHVLRRLLMPRHPPCALLRLTFRRPFQGDFVNYKAAVQELCKLHLQKLFFVKLQITLLLGFSTFFANFFCRFAFSFSPFVQFSRCRWKDVPSKLNNVNFTQLREGLTWNLPDCLPACLP